MAKQEDINLLAKLLFGEAASEGGSDLDAKRESMHAIANTIQNRSNISGQPLVFEATKPGQYSAYSLQTYWRGLDKWIKSPGNKEAYQVAMEVAMDLADNKLKDITGGATFYYNPKVVNMPSHIRGQKSIGTFGDHVYYKDIAPYTASAVKTVEPKKVVQPAPQPVEPLSQIEPMKGTQPQKSLASIIPAQETPVTAAPKSLPTINVGRSSPEQDRMFETLEKVKRRSKTHGVLNDGISKALKNWLDVLPRKDLKKAKEYLGEDFPK